MHTSVESWYIKLSDVLLKKRLGVTVWPYQEQTGKSYEKKIADFDVFYYTFLSTDEKNDKNVATLVEHSKTDLVKVELFDLVKYYES